MGQHDVWTVYTDLCSPTFVEGTSTILDLHNTLTNSTLPDLHSVEPNIASLTTLGDGQSQILSLPDDLDFPDAGDSSLGHYICDPTPPAETPSLHDWLSEVGLFHNCSVIDWPPLLGTSPFFETYDYATGSDDDDFAPSREAIAVQTELQAPPFETVAHGSYWQARASILRLFQEVTDLSPSG